MAQNSNGVDSAPSALSYTIDSLTTESKDTSQSAKKLPKDQQVVTAIIKEEGIIDFDPKCVHFITDFIYKYVTNVLEEARAYSNIPKVGGQKTPLGVDDVHLAMQLYADPMFVMPPLHDEVLSMVKKVNAVPLPEVKPHCGIRLPPERYCVTINNYAAKKRSKASTMKNANTYILKMPIRPPSFDKALIPHTDMKPTPK